MPVSAVLFDAYGTLLDIHASVARHRVRLGEQADALSALWRQKQLEYTWTLTLAGDYRPFDALTEEALDFALGQYSVVDTGLRQHLLAAYRTLNAFPDVVPALTALTAQGRRLGVLSNGTGAMLREAFGAAGLASRLDPLLSVENLRLYKPDPRVYQMACDTLGLGASKIGFVSSNGWDAMGAARFGFQVFWLRRKDGPAEYDLPAKVTTLSHLGELVGKLG